MYVDYNAILPYVCRAIAMLTAIPVHEAAHAYVSYKLGDPTAKNYGRLSLNPLHHFDPLGAICLVTVGFGWAKPVPIGTNNFRHPKRDMAISAAAGPASNVIMAYLSIVLYKIVFYATPSTFGATYTVNSGWDFLAMVLYYMLTMNIVLAVFNLVPVPPLDGSRMFLVWLPQKLYFGIMKYERYIMLALFALVFFGALDAPLRAVRGALTTGLWNASGFIDAIFLRAHTVTQYV